VFSLTRTKNRNKIRSQLLASESGQAVVEFVLTMVILLTMLMFVIQVTLFLSFGNFVQYSTFMSARAYLSGWPTEAEQLKHAEAVLGRTVKLNGNDRFSLAARGINGTSAVKGADIGREASFDPNNETLSWLQGVRYSFKGRLFLHPLAPSSMETSASEVDLKSESWLGREPTYNECRTEMGSNLFDNGC
jgi:hypothetical protein